MTTCRGCSERWRARYWTRYDGYGRARMHERGYDDIAASNYEAMMCQAQSWFSRHPFYTTFLILGVAWICLMAAVVLRLI